MLFPRYNLVLGGNWQKLRTKSSGLSGMTVLMSGFDNDMRLSVSKCDDAVANIL